MKGREPPVYQKGSVRWPRSEGAATHARMNHARTQIRSNGVTPQIRSNGVTDDKNTIVAINEWRCYLICINSAATALRIDKKNLENTNLNRIAFKYLSIITDPMQWQSTQIGKNQHICGPFASHNHLSTIQMT